MERLRQYSWPGNIRELQTVLKHAMLHAIGPTLVPEFLPPELQEAASAPSLPPLPAVEGGDVSSAQRSVTDFPPEGGDVAFREFIENQLRLGTRSLYADSVKHMESILLTDVLRYTDGNRSQAAMLLGITRGCLRSKLRQHGIMISSSIVIRHDFGVGFEHNDAVTHSASPVS